MKEKTNVFKNLVWVIKYTYFFDKKYIFVIGFAMTIAGVIPPISTLLSQEIINGLQNKASLKVIFISVALYIFMDLFQAVFNYLLQYYKIKFSLKFNLYFNELVLKKATRLSLKSYEDSETYDMINRAQYEGNGKLLLYLETFMSIFSSFVTMISYLMIIMVFKPWIVICIIFIPILKFLISNKINKLSFKIIKDRTNDSRKCWYIQYMLTYGEYYKELKIYNLFDFFIGKYDKYNKKFNQDDLKLEKNRTQKLGVITLFENLIDGLLFCYIIYYGYSGRILIGNVLTYMKTIAQVKIQISTMLDTFSSMSKESLFINQLISYFNLLEESCSGEGIKIDQVRSIRTKNLCYKYRESQDYVLKNVNLEIKQNEIVVIIGQNGSGKSTLIKILMGFYEDYEGDIYINDINLKDIDKNLFRSKIATLFQDFVKYEGTVRENIAYGNLDICKDDVKIKSIADLFELTKLISESKNGLDCQLGNWFDNGKQISLGQWQKIALSRAFAKQAEVYILDEPNSALDPISEYSLSQLYSKLFGKHIGIIVAHKFNNFIKDIDNIILLSNGEITGKGSHEILIKSNQEYKDLYEIQTGKGRGTKTVYEMKK